MITQISKRWNIECPGAKRILATGCLGEIADVKPPSGATAYVARRMVRFLSWNGGHTPGCPACLEGAKHHSLLCKSKGREFDAVERREKHPEARSLAVWGRPTDAAVAARDLARAKSKPISKAIA